MPKERKEFFVIAHNIRSLLNVGSVFRTADAFGVTKVYLTGYTGTPRNPIHGNKISKSALGAEKSMAWEHRSSAVRLIKDLRLQYPKILIVALENNMVGTRVQFIRKFRAKFPLALVLGEEVKGINRSLIQLCDTIVEIPMHGKKESLNLAVAFGIVAYEISKLYS